MITLFFCNVFISVFGEFKCTVLVCLFDFSCLLYFYNILQPNIQNIPLSASDLNIINIMQYDIRDICIKCCISNNHVTSQAVIPYQRNTFPGDRALDELAMKLVDLGWTLTILQTSTISKKITGAMH